MDARVATAADLAAVTQTISRAFHDDPTWSWAFPDASRRQEQYGVWWQQMADPQGNEFCVVADPPPADSTPEPEED